MVGRFNRQARLRINNLYRYIIAAQIDNKLLYFNVLSQNCKRNHGRLGVRGKSCFELLSLRDGVIDNAVF